MRRDNNDISMIVLAGGRSSRMGRDKADLLYSGKTFLEWQIGKCRSLGITDIIVSGYRGQHCQMKVLHDRYPEKGPLGGLECCLEDIETRFDGSRWCLVLSVDVPLVPNAVLQDLIEKARKSEKNAVILQHGDKQESLIGMYRACLSEKMREEILVRKGSVFAFLRRIGYETFDTDMEDIYFQNINDPEIYRMAIKDRLEVWSSDEAERKEYAGE